MGTRHGSESLAEVPSRRSPSCEKRERERKGRPPGEPRDRPIRMRGRSDRILQRFPDSEPDATAGSDRDRLTRVRITPHACLARLELEGSEPGERDALVFLKALLDTAQ